MASPLGTGPSRATPGPAILLALLLIPPVLPTLAAEAEAPTVVVTFTRAVTDGEWEDFLHAADVPVATPVRVVPGVILPLPVGNEARVRALPFVARIDPVQPLQLLVDHAGRLSRAGEALADLGVTGAGVTVAVVDSGVDARHPDLDGRVLANVRLTNGQFRDSPGDSDGHGTHVAGIVAGDGTASEGRYRGAAPDANLVGVDIRARFDTASALLAFDWILLNRDAYDIRVVVNSWGRVDRAGHFDPADPVIAAADRLVRNGIVLVFSASNHGPTDGTLSLEAQNPNVVTVGATDDAGNVAPYSSRGPVNLAAGPADWVKPDLVAGGTDVVSARAVAAVPTDAPGVLQNPYYRSLTGTSQAAPLVAGVIACMLEANPRLTPGEVQRALRVSAIDLGNRGPDNHYGFGLMDAVDAVRIARGGEPEYDNVLIQGGEERYEDAGTLQTGATGILPGNAFTTARRVEVPFPVKPGAESLTVAFRWQPVDAAFRLRLEDETGNPRGQWNTGVTDGNERVIRASVAPPEPGVYRLVATSESVEPATWTSTVLLTLGAQPEHANHLDPRYLLDADAPAIARATAHFDHQIARARLQYEQWKEDPQGYVRDHPGTFAAALAVTLASGTAVGAGGAWTYRRVR